MEDCRMLARELMTSEPLVVLPSDPIWRAAETMRYHQVGCIPVVADEQSMHLVGILTDRDIAVRCVARKHASTCLVRDHMTSAPLHTALGGEDVIEALHTMESFSVRRIPVVADDGRLIGIISQGDLMRKLSRRDPMLVEHTLERVFATSAPVR